MHRQDLDQSPEGEKDSDSLTNDHTSSDKEITKCQIVQEQDLLKKLSLIGEMSSYIAHEVRNPMTTVRGMAQLLAMEHPEKSSYYQLMIEEIDQADEVLKEFLYLARNSPLTLTQVRLNDIVYRAVDLLYSQAVKKNLHIGISLTDNVYVYADEEKLIQVFMHVLRNAIEASRKDGSIFILSRCIDKWVRVKIIDEGIGMNGSLLKKVVEPFFTTKEEKHGLGLPVAYKIIEDHGGQLEIASRPGKGTVLEICLPRLAVKSETELA
jgi:signal transduction histidine kinase